jgi:asparaginyl-tRNA synthetase
MRRGAGAPESGEPPSTSIRSIGERAGQEVALRGWLYQSRSSGKVAFLLVRDGTGIIQCVVSKAEVAEEVFEAARQATQESSVVVTGLVRRDDRAPGGYELSVTDFRTYQTAEEYPISPKEHGVDFLMSHRHLWLRSRRPHAVLSIRSTVVQALRMFFEREGFVLVDAPIFTPSAPEGTTTLFETEYFGGKAYLTQSGQLYMEAAAMAFGKVYCFGPTFRAEKHKTRRHLNEFWMLEPEMAWAGLEDVIDLSERMVVDAIRAVLEKRRRELETLERDPARLEAVRAPFPRLSYDEAIRVLNERGCSIEWGADIGGDEETVLAEGSEQPLFVHRFPRELKAFYMAPDPEDARLALGVDLLAPEGYGEIVGGGVRAESLDYLDEQIRKHGLPPEPLEWYRDLRRYGSVPHAGFGLGLERLIAWLTGIDHVRETIPFPRTMNRIYP